MNLWSAGGKAIVASLTQGLPSITSLVISITAAKTLPINEFGKFGLIFAAITLTIGLTRSFTGEAVIYSTPITKERRLGANSVMSLLLFAALANTIISFGLILSGLQDSWKIVVVLMTATILLTQDVSRTLLFALGSTSIALFSEILILVLVVLLTSVDEPKTISEVLKIWMYAATLPTIVSVLFLRPSLAFRSSSSWIKHHKGLGLSLASDYVLSNGLSQASIYLVAAFTGPAGAAAFRGAQMIAAPLQVFGRSFMLILTAKRAMIAKVAPKLGSPMSLGVMFAGSLLLISGSLLILFYFLPRESFVWLYGDSHNVVIKVIPIAIIAAGFGFFASGGGLALRLSGLHVKAAVIRGKLFPFSLSIIMVGTIVDGSAGTFFALAISEIFRGILNWRAALIHTTDRN